MPNGLTLKEISAQSGDFAPEFKSPILIEGLPVPLDQFKKWIPEFFVDNNLKSVLDILPAFRLADARVEESKVFYMLQDLLDSVAILVEWPSRLLEIPGIEWTFNEFLMTCETRNRSLLVELES